MPQIGRSSNTDFLMNYFGNSNIPKPLGASQKDIANMILVNAKIDKPLGGGGNESEGNEPSLMSRIFDVLSRPNYAIAETVRTGSPMGLIEGLSGKKKTTFSDVLEEYGVEDNRVAAAGGLALDIFTDPLTYVPGGTFVKGAKAVGRAARGTKPVDRAADLERALGDKTLAQKLLHGDKEAVFPENFGLPAPGKVEIPDVLRKKFEPEFPTNTLDEAAEAVPPPGKPTDAIPGQLELDLPDVPKGIPKQKSIIDDVTEALDSGASHVPGQQAFRFPKFNVTKIRKTTANDIVEEVAQEQTEALIRVAPKVKSLPDKRDVSDAERIVAGWDNTKTTADLNRKYPESLNAKQQVKLYYRARDAARARFKNPDSPANAGRVNSIAVRIYNAAEKRLEDSGLVPRIGTGENLRLSDVISELVDSRKVESVLAEFGSEIKSGSELWQITQALRARGAIDDSKKVKDIVDNVQAAAVQTRSSNLLSDAQLQQVERILGKIGGASARAAAVSPAAEKTTRSLVHTALNAGKTRADIAVEGKAKIVDDILAGRAKKGQRAEVNQATTKALEEDLGKCPRWAQSDNKAVEFLMGRVATWWGQRDLRPISLNAIGSASSTAAARGKALDDLFKPFNQQQRHEAFMLAKGIGRPSSEATYQLATQIHRLMDNMVGQTAGASVLTRSAVDMDMLNKWMGKYRVDFNFTNKIIKDDLSGVVVDYSKGTDWLNSWKSFTPKEDPKVFLFKLQEAMEQATREKALFDEIGERFGTKVPGKGFRTNIDHVYIKDYYFTDDIAKQLPRVIRDWSIGPWNTNNPLLKLYDRVLSMWKAGVTIYRPGHHIRNMIGDVYLGWMDGVNSVKPYTLAARVQKTLRDSYSDLNDVDELVKLGVLGKQYGTPLPGEVIFRNKSGVEFTADQIAAVAHQKGLLEHARTLEDIIDLGEGSRFKPLGGRVQAVARGASELQSHNARLAHFIDKVMKSKGTNLEDIFEQASRRARKWHPTGLDLTDFERKVMRRIIPFYSWIRKSTPLLLEGLVMNPGKTVIPAKIYDAVQHAQGIETPGRHDPFPVDQMFPEWLRAEGLGPVSKGEGFLGKFSDQMPPGYVMGGMGINPLASLMAQAQSPGKTALSSLTPAVGVPLELATGRKSFTGEPITGPDARPGAFEQYVGEQIPIWSNIQGITGTTPFGTDTKRSMRSDEAGKEAVVNWLSGLGIKGTGPYIKQGRYEQRAPQIAQQKVRKEEFLAQLREQLGM